MNQLTPSEQRLVDALASAGKDGMSAADLAEELGLAISTINNLRIEIEKKGVVLTVGYRRSIERGTRLYRRRVYVLGRHEFKKKHIGPLTPTEKTRRHREKAKAQTANSIFALGSVRSTVRVPFI